MTIHWVYPSGPQIRAPETIGRNVASRLRARGYDVVQHPWEEFGRIEPAPGDVLIGHANPLWGTVFRASAGRRGWRRVIVLEPYAHGTLDQMAWLDGILPRCDLFLAITGKYWFRRVEESPFAHWRPKMVHLDLAVDRADFPRVKGPFNPPGRRRCLYVGADNWLKNTAYLSAIATRLPGTEFSWAGGRGTLPGLRTLGSLDFSTPEARAIVAEHDFMVTVSRSDANPTTLLESAAWGLVPVCTPQSGYEDEPGFVNVPLDDVDGAVRILEELQHAPGERLEALRAANDRRLDDHYTWDRFADQVVDAIESTESPALGAAPLAQRLRLGLAALTSRDSPLRPRNLNSMRRRRRAARRARATAGH